MAALETCDILILPTHCSKMAAASIFRANFPTFHRLVLPLLSNAFLDKEPVQVIEHTPALVQVLVVSHKLEDTENSAKAPRIQLTREGSAGSDEP